MASKQSIKGSNYERELAAYLNEFAYLGQHKCERAALSGGGRVGLYTGGADLLGTPGLFIEAKRVEKLNFRDAVRQSEDNLKQTNKSGTERPIVITRRSREATGASLCVLRLEDFLHFYRAWLKLNGYLKPSGETE
jgi:hypothetical protein